MASDEHAERPKPPQPKRPPEEVARRPECPSCGSAHTQPFTHAGPGARLNMKCIDCGHLFREKTIRR